MNGLNPTTDAGRSAVAEVEGVCAEIAVGADARDAAGRFDPAPMQLLRDRGISSLTCPVELGGGGASSVSDMMAMAERLARADASLAIAFTMHNGISWGMGRMVLSAPESPPAGLARRLLESVVAGDAWIAAAVTEGGTNYFHPRATLDAQPDGSWLLTAEKLFATGSPGATHLAVGVRRDEILTQVIVPTATDGVEVVDDWDGLGMRSSGSGRIVATEAQLPADSLVMPGGRWGQFSIAAVLGRTFANAPNVATGLGIAEAAAQIARDRVSGGGRVTALSERPAVRNALGELEIELNTCRSVLSEFGRTADRVALDPPSDIADALRLMAQFQTAKLVANRAAVAVVDKAALLVGGSAYVSGQTIARLVRDVRAGQYMQPFSPHEAVQFIGTIAAGGDPDPGA